MYFGNDLLTSYVRDLGLNPSDALEKEEKEESQPVIKNHQGLCPALQQGLASILETLD